MTRSLIALTAALMTTALHAQEPPVSPTQAETLTKWPWSISIQTAPFARDSVEITLAPLEGWNTSIASTRTRACSTRGRRRERSIGSCTVNPTTLRRDTPSSSTPQTETRPMRVHRAILGYPRMVVGEYGRRRRNNHAHDTGFYTESHEFRRGRR